MKVLLIYAHPEPRSLNGGLKNFAIRHLLQAGHEVQVSDLYAWTLNRPLPKVLKARISPPSRKSCCGPIR